MKLNSNLSLKLLKKIQFIFLTYHSFFILYILFKITLMYMTLI